MSPLVSQHPVRPGTPPAGGRRRRIVCLADSRKHGGYCVAGIEPETGAWIRPVSELDDGRIERETRLVDGRPPRLGEILLVPLAATGPDFGFQGENLALLPGPWSSDGTLTADQMLSLCSNQPFILHNAEPYVTVQYLQSLPAKDRRTLQLVEAYDFRTFSDGPSANGGHKWKATFVSNRGQRLTAMVTDPVLVEKLEQGYVPSDYSLVTVSLSMPMRPRDWTEETDPCWKLIAGVVEVGQGTWQRPPAMSAQPPIVRSGRDRTEAAEVDEERMKTALHRVFGFHSFRPHQEGIVRALLAGRDVFGVMPTGGGKSLCYQLPAHLLPGTCVVISPLISLMKDQVDAAVDNGLRAACLTSGQPDDARVSVFRRLSAGELDLLYVSPERFAMEAFLNALKRARICFFAIDEAHCISEWGHDFRPDYLFLANIVKLFPSVPVAAFTATATHRVAQDIQTRLGLRDPFLVRASFDRPNLFYRVVPKDDPLGQILDYVKQRPNESGIVYRMTRKDVDRTVEELTESGVSALGYHAGMDDHTRAHNQEAFNRDEVRVMAATIAFGMGIDKPNIRYVVHGDLPKNMESYYQETGRAGRDGEPSECLLLFGQGDIPRIRFFIQKVEDDRERRRLEASLREMVSYSSLGGCRRKKILAYFGEQYPREKCTGCDACSASENKQEATSDAVILLSAVAEVEEGFGAGHIVDIVTGSNTAQIRRFRHQTLRSYGAGAGHDKRYWRGVMGELLSQAVLTQTQGSFPKLELTDAARAILGGKSRFLAAGAPVAKAPEVQPTLQTPNPELFEELRRLRFSLATEKNVPAFVIFSDRTLREMAAAVPLNEEEFERISGVGQHKVEAYGTTFLKTISAFVKSHPELVSQCPVVEAPRQRRRRREPRQVGESVRETWALLQKGLSIEQVAESRGLVAGTVGAHMQRLISRGLIADIDPYVPPEARAKIEKLFDELQTELTGEVVRASGGTVSYEQAGLVRAWRKVRRGNV